MLATSGTTVVHRSVPSFLQPVWLLWVVRGWSSCSPAQRTAEVLPLAMYVADNVLRLRGALPPARSVSYMRCRAAAWLLLRCVDVWLNRRYRGAMHTSLVHSQSTASPQQLPSSAGGEAAALLASTARLLFVSCGPQLAMSAFLMPMWLRWGVRRGRGSAAACVPHRRMTSGCGAHPCALSALRRKGSL